MNSLAQYRNTTPFVVADRRAGLVRMARPDAEADRVMSTSTRLPSIITAATPRRIITFVAVLLVALVPAPGDPQRVLDEDHLRDGGLLARHARARSARRSHGHVLAVPDPDGRRRGMVRAADALPARWRAVPRDPARHRRADRIARRRHRAARAAPEWPVPGARDADGGRRDHAAADGRQVPQQQQGLLGLRQAQPVGPERAAAAECRRGRHRLLPLHRRRRGDRVPRRGVAREGQARARLGCDPAVGDHRHRGRRQQHALQAVGVRPVGCDHRRRRCAAGCRCRRHGHAVPGRAVDPAAGRRVAGRRLQPLGCARRRLLPAGAPEDPRRQARPAARGADDAVRAGRDAGDPRAAARASSRTCASSDC